MKITEAKPRSPRYLSEQERIQIADLLAARMSVRRIAEQLGRAPSTISREIFTGSAFDNVFDTHGKGIGDVEAAIRYQIADGRDNNKPYVVGALRFKARNGKDPFEVPTDCVTRCIGNATLSPPCASRGRPFSCVRTFFRTSRCCVIALRS